MNYYDPYRSVPEVNHYSYQPQPLSQQNHHLNQSVQNISHSGQVNYQPQSFNYIERDESQESYYSNNSAKAAPKNFQNPTPTSRKLVTASFAENGHHHKGGKSRSPSRIYKTHSDLTKKEKEKSRLKKTSTKDENSLSHHHLQKKDIEQIKNDVIRKEIEILKKEQQNSQNDVLHQILKKTAHIEINVQSVNQKLEQVLINQKQLISRVETIERDMKSSSALSPELLKEIKDALNIDFDIDLEIKPDEKINKYSINSIKAYKSQGSNE